MLSETDELHKEIIGHFEIDSCESYKKEIDEAISKSVRFEYSSYREPGYGCGGYYNPNWGDFLVVGGYKRGKLLKSCKMPKKYGYQYGFDDSGRLAFDHSCFDNETRIFDNYGIYKYEGNSVYVVRGSIRSDDFYYIDAWSKAIYDKNRIKDYYLYEGLITNLDCKSTQIFFLHQYSYTYSEDEILYIKKTLLTQTKSTYEQYRFILDENQEILFYYDEKGNKYFK